MDSHTNVSRRVAGCISRASESQMRGVLSIRGGGSRPIPW